jgi:L-asparagine transporter-like permease
VGGDVTAQQGRGAQAAGRNETPEERSDRNWNELLQELRVTQTGAQILTGFLLTLPFQQSFARLDRGQVTIYLVLVILAAVTTVLVVTPVSAHRLLFQRRLKPELVRAGHRAALGGLACLALVVTGTVLLIFDVVVGREAATIAALAMLALIVVGWAVVPLTAGRRRPRG